MKTHVLLVEDNPGDALLVQEYLSDTDPNIQIETASSLSQAAERLRPNTQAVLLDLSLPDAQGLETVQRMRGLAPHLPIVVMSGISDREVALEALQNGAQDFLVKGRSDGESLARALRYAVERAEMLRQLEQQNMQLALRSELALSAARLVAWDWRLEDDWLTFSDNATEVLGAAASGWTHFDQAVAAIHPEDRAEHKQMVKQAITQKTGFRSTCRIWVESRQEYIFVEQHAVVRLSPSGEVLGFNGVSQDISQQKRAELNLRRINQAQKRFVGDAAHELRAPLTSIQGNLGLLRRYPDMPASERFEALEDAHREASRLGRLVSDLLALARGDAGEGLRLEPVRLHELLQESLRQANHLTSQHRLRLGEFAECTVLGDPDRLRQLALILLENAIKYTPQGGFIELSLECDPEWSELRVRDSGIGISPEDLPHVFERFYRADKARVRGQDPGGTGLGLPIAHWIVAQHGGEIRLESQLGQGTTAIVRLPVAP
jgi:PAS domain S-box-containing protein